MAETENKPLKDPHPDILEPRMKDDAADLILDWYMGLEGRLVEVTKVVPLADCSLSVRIPALGGIILEAGALVDTIFRETIETDASRDSLSMKHFAPYFVKKMRLAHLRTLLFRWPPRYLEPFAEWRTNQGTPAWWSVCNHMKHSRVQYLAESTLGHAVMACCGLHQVISQSPSFWRPLLRRDLVTSQMYNVANFISGLERAQPWDAAVMVESEIFCTPLGGLRFPDDISSLANHLVASMGSRRLQRFLGLA